MIIILPNEEHHTTPILWFTYFEYIYSVSYLNSLSCNDCPGKTQTSNLYRHVHVYLQQLQNIMYVYGVSIKEMNANRMLYTYLTLRVLLKYYLYNTLSRIVELVCQISHVFSHTQCIICFAEFAHNEIPW